MLLKLLSQFGRGVRGAGATVGERPVSIWFTNHDSTWFRWFAPAIVNAAMERVVGVVAPEDPEHRFVSADFERRRVPFRTVEELQMEAAMGPVQLVHFCESPADYPAVERIAASAGVEPVDFVAALHALDLPHTYQSMRIEQDYARRSGMAFARVRARLADRLSVETLDARIEAMTRLDRRALLRVTQGLDVEYYNASNPLASLIPEPDGVYIDVGAAHGDTVERFAATVGGRFRAIHAFEPTPSQFPHLARVAAADPRIHAYQCAVGESAGRIPFYENPDVPFGSNALALDRAPEGAEVDCVRLDDVVDECTLLKLDVEGFECAVLRGARHLIARTRPDLAIACYHYPADLVEIFDLVEEIHPYRQVALRHYGTGLFDTVFLFSDRHSFAPAGA